MDTYLDNYQSAVGPLMGARGLDFLISDSWEAGAQNWTDRHDRGVHEAARLRSAPVAARAHRTRRGERRSQRPLPLGLPARRSRTCVAEYHYDQITTLLKAARHGPLRRVARGRAARSIGDGMEVKRTQRRADVARCGRSGRASTPISPATTPTSASPPRSRTSTGRTCVAAESLTAGSAAWAWSPATLKPTADKELAMGLNRFVHPHVGAPAARRQGPRPEPRPVRPVVHAQRDLGRAGEPWVTLSRPELLPAAAGPLRRRRRVLLRRGHERHGALPREGARSPAMATTSTT